MKNLFKKAVSLTIALSTVAAMSVSAFADPVATPSASKDAVTVTGYETVGPGQYAVAVVEKTFLGSGTEDDNAKIYYVNQAADTGEVNINTILANMLLKEELAPGNYEVRIGTNATIEAGEHPAYTCIDLVIAAPSTGGDFITSTDTTKGKITKKVATASNWLFGDMGARVTLNLDATAYPDFTQDAETGLYTKNYTVEVVDADGNAITGAEVYFSAESGKYVALVPTGQVDTCKFKVTAGTSTNTALGTYGDANGTGGLQTGDRTIVARLLNGKLTSTTYTDTNVEKLRIDVNGDGSFSTADRTVIARILNGKLAKMPILNQ